MQREKIAITVKKDILSRLDRTIDGEHIRNRSHAIEVLLYRALRPSVRKALIFAGQSIRLPQTNRRFPAALLLFGGKPVLDRQIELLKAAGISDIVVVVDSRSGDIAKYLLDGKKFGVRAQYAEQGVQEVGSAHAFWLARNAFGSKDPFLMLYGDVVAHIDLADFINFHLDSNHAATIALTSVEDPSLYGAVTVKGENIVSFTEMPKAREGVSRVINAGIFCLEPEVLSVDFSKKTAALEQDFFPQLAKEGKLGGYLFEGKWCNVRNQVCYEVPRSKIKMFVPTAAL